MNKLLVLFLSLACTLQAVAQAPQPPEIAARHYVLVDLSSQQVLAEREADAPSDPASLTKLMTAYLVFNALRDKKITLEQTLPVSTLAWAERKGGGSLMFIDTTMTPTVAELLRELQDIDNHVEQVAVPLSYADELYSLRSHIQMVRRRLQLPPSDVAGSA